MRQIESLEVRRLLSAAVEKVGNVLAILGTSNADNITVRDHPTKSALITVIIDDGTKTDFSRSTIDQFEISSVAGNDWIDLSGLAAPWNHRAGTTPLTLIRGGKGNDTILGSGLADEIESGDGVDSAMGNGGPDTIGAWSARGESDTIDGGAGNDTLAGAGSLSGGNGSDRIIGNGLLRGGLGADNIEVADRETGIANRVFGDDGADTLLVRRQGNYTQSSTQLFGGRGNDTITPDVGFLGNPNLGFLPRAFTEAAISYVNAGPGDDVVHSADLCELAPMLGDDRLEDSRASMDLVVGTGGNDAISLRDDLTRPGYAIASVNGVEQSLQLSRRRPLLVAALAGDDQIDASAFSGDRSNVYVFAGSGNDHILAARRMAFHGEAGNDSITGTSDIDILYGGTGNDTINGAAGNDSIWGGDADDVIIGGAGADGIQGDGDYDLYFGKAEPGNDFIDGAEGDDTIDGEFGDDTLVGGLGNDRAAGGRGADSVSGNAGADWLVGGDGEDIVDGGAGDDRMDGNKGNDTLFGRDGTDALFGSDGDDQLTDGKRDLLVGGAGLDEAAGGGSLTDNSRETHDRIAATAEDPGPASLPNSPVPNRLEEVAYLGGPTVPSGAGASLIGGFAITSNAVFLQTMTGTVDLTDFGLLAANFGSSSTADFQQISSKYAEPLIATGTGISVNQDPLGYYIFDTTKPASIDGVLSTAKASLVTLPVNSNIDGFVRTPSSIGLKIGQSGQLYVPRGSLIAIPNTGSKNKATYATFKSGKLTVPTSGVLVIAGKTKAYRITSQRGDKPTGVASGDTVINVQGGFIVIPRGGSAARFIAAS